MIHIFAGTVRGGTSMMGRCLEAGGLEVNVSERREAALQRNLPTANPDGFYEGDQAWMRDRGAALALDGQAAKVFLHGLTRLPKYVGVTYRVVLLRRDPEAMRASVADQLGLRPILFRVHRTFPSIIRSTSMRGDVVSFDVFDYDEAVADPLPVFERLVASGWPIDPVAAARIPDPKLRRYHTLT